MSTGKTITQHNLESQAIPNRYTPLTIALNFRERSWLWDRIDRRVEQMMDLGLEHEVQDLLRRGISPECTAMQAIGYKELAAALLAGRPIQDGVDEVKLRSRQYAKRQLTWFRRNQEVHWLLWEREPDFSAAVQDSTQLVHASGLQ